MKQLFVSIFYFILITTSLRAMPRHFWSKEEDQILLKYIQDNKDSCSENTQIWSNASKLLVGRNGDQCRKRYMDHLDSNLKKGKWTPEEDQILIDCINEYGRVWSIISEHINGRTSDQCMKRYMNTLSPSIKRGKWTPEEDQILIDCVKKHGKNWAIAKTQLQGRTNHQCRERYINYLSQKNISEWTTDEDNFLKEKVDEIGFKWKCLKKFFKGRKYQDLKNRYNIIKRKNFNFVLPEINITRSPLLNIDNEKPFSIKNLLN